MTYCVLSDINDLFIIQGYLFYYIGISLNKYFATPLGWTFLAHKYGRLRYALGGSSPSLIEAREGSHWDKEM